MEFHKKLKSNIIKLQDVFDLAAFCYDYLITEIPDQEIFIGEYLLPNENEDLMNPNLDKLNKFSAWVKSHLLECDCDSKHSALPFEYCIQDIEKEVGKLKLGLSPFGDAMQNEAVISLYILYAIDRYLAESKIKCVKRGICNRSYCKKSYIYRASRYNILDEAAFELDFPHEIKPMTIRNQLRHLVILEKQELEKGTNPPVAERLWIASTDKYRQALLRKKELTFAVIPLEKAYMTLFPRTTGGVFKVDYTDRHLKYGSQKALELLDLAIEQKANIVIFPEFVCYPSLQEAISRHLEEKYEKDPESIKDLLFVAAGSGWTEDNNNVAQIFSYSGRLLGKQYKYVKFSKFNDNGTGMVEGLKNPGLKSLICEVEGIGQFMFAICRDVSERGRTRKLAELFRPQFLLVPAWSKSVRNGFEKQFCEIAEQNHRTCSLVCNCCEAFGVERDNRKINSVVVTPYIEEKLVRGKTDSLLRDNICKRKGPCGGCVFMLKMQFEINAVREQKIVQEIAFNRLNDC